MPSTASARIILLLGIASFLFWRINPTLVSRWHLHALDFVSPVVGLISVPVDLVEEGFSEIDNYLAVYSRNMELRQEIQKLRSWREVALKHEEENASLRALNKVPLDTRISYAAGEVISSAGGPFQQRVIVGVGSKDGIEDGSAAVDGNGLVGRVWGVNEHTSRLLLLTDPESRVPIIIRPSGRRAVLVGDNSDFPKVEFLLSIEGVRPGDRVLTSGDGSVMPHNLFVGTIAAVGARGARVGLAANYERLEFVRILRFRSIAKIDGEGQLVAPVIGEQSNETPSAPDKAATEKEQ